MERSLELLSSNVARRVGMRRKEAVAAQHYALVLAAKVLRHGVETSKRLRQAHRVGRVVERDRQLASKSKYLRVWLAA